MEYDLDVHRQVVIIIMQLVGDLICLFVLFTLFQSTFFKVEF